MKKKELSLNWRVTNIGHVEKIVKETTCRKRKELGYLHEPIKRKQDTQEKKGLTAWHKATFGNHVFGREEGSIWEKNINRSDWEVIEEQVGNDGILSVYFLYYVVYFFYHV